MIKVIGVTLVISIIEFMTVIKSKFIFNFLLDLISMGKTYLHNVPTMMAPLISQIFLTPKVIISGSISH